jgi:hypothetical protein
MTTPSADQVQHQALDYMKQGQEALTQVISTLSENWASALRGTATAGGSLPGMPEGAPKPAEAIDRAFDFTIQMLEAQRRFAHQLLDAASPAIRATEAAVDSAADRARTR